MALVGEVIVRVRNQANDPCQCLNQPFGPSLVSTGSGTLTGSLHGILTWLNQYGETVGSNETSIIGLGNSQVRINSIVPVGATSGRFYYASFSGQEQQYAVLGTTGTDFIGVPGQTIIPGVPPYKPSAYLPDSDGDMISAFEMYRWLNAGLAELGRLTGGILDQTGIAMPLGQAEIAIPGWWLRIKYVWHNGWLTLAEQQSYTWLQSPVQGIPGIVTLWKNSAQQVLGTWPQPSTAPTATTLTAPMGATDNVANVLSATGFTAPGMCQIDQEIMSYSQADTTNNQLTGIVRGYSGTIMASHLVGATCTQLILRLLGRRMPVMLAPGQSNNTLDLPMAWDAMLDDYLLAKYSMSMGDKQGAAALYQKFVAGCKEQRDDSLPLESKQVGGLYPLGGAAQTLAEVMDVVVVN